MKRRGDTIDLEVRIVQRTERAILVHHYDNPDRHYWRCWLPLALVEATPGGKPQQYTVTLPYWLAMERGMIPAERGRP